MNFDVGDWIVVLAIIAWTAIVAGVGGKLTVIDEWYYSLEKPSWKPADWAIGPIWTVIFVLGGVAAFRAWSAADGFGVQALFVFLALLNASLNVFWNVLFFAWKRPDWALLEIPVLWLSTVAFALLFYRLDALAGILMAPYVIWVAIAGFLNRDIALRNAPFGA